MTSHHSKRSNLLLTSLALGALVSLPAGCARPTEAQCKEFVEHVKKLTLDELAPKGEAAVKAGGESFEKEGREKLMKTCVEQGSKRELDCVMAAKSLADLAKCS